MEVKKRPNIFLSYRIPCSGLQTNICVKPPSKGKMMTKIIERKGAWEKAIVNSVIRVMEAHPTAVFLDIGANIGMYTLVIAAMRRQVLAVDADSRNLAYIRKSLEISKTTDYVELIYNAIRFVVSLV